jgi:hypothetical protein
MKSVVSETCLDARFDPRNPAAMLVESISYGLAFDDHRSSLEVKGEINGRRARMRKSKILEYVRRIMPDH